MSGFKPEPPPKSFEEVGDQPDLGRPSAEMLLTLPKFITGEIMFGIPSFTSSKDAREEMERRNHERP